MEEKIFTKKQRITLWVLAGALVATWAVLSFFCKEEWIPRLSLWANLVFGTGSMITAILALTISILSWKKSEALRKQKIEEEESKNKKKGRTG